MSFDPTTGKYVPIEVSLACSWSEVERLARVPGVQLEVTGQRGRLEIVAVDKKRGIVTLAPVGAYGPPSLPVDATRKSFRSRLLPADAAFFEGGDL